MTGPVDPAGPPEAGTAADLQSRMDEYAAKVAERVAEEAAAGPEGAPVNGDIKPGFIRACFDANELGDGLLFKAVNQDRLLFDKAMDSWLVWTSHHWAVDRMGAARAGVEKVVGKYGEELAAINKKIREAEADGAGERLAFFRTRAKGLRARISQLRSRKRANNCLDFAHNCEETHGYTRRRNRQEAPVAGLRQRRDQPGYRGTGTRSP